MTTLVNKMNRDVKIIIPNMREFRVFYSDNEGSTIFFKRDWEEEKTTKQEEQVWSEEDEEMRNLIVAIFEVNHPDGFFKVNELGTTDMRGVHTEEIISWLKSLPLNLKKKNEDVAKLCSDEWSEEDRKMYNIFRSMVHGTYVVETQESMDSLLSWLKSLLERVNLQSKEEWSEEDEMKREGVIQWLREYQKKFNPKYDSLSIESIDSLIDWFKSLHPIKQEWSEEDERTISDACCWIAEYAGYLMDKNYGKASMLMGLTEKLKSLCPSWKPSEEQIEAIKHAYNSFPNDCPTKSNLRLLYYDLKKLM